MADSESGGSSATPWLAFLVGIVVVALLVVGFVAFNGGVPQQQTADLNIEAPRVDLPEVNPPDVDLPEVPNVTPPSAEPPVEPVTQ